MIYSEIEYPLRLCVEMLHFCFWSNAKTENKKASEIKTMLLNFFTQEQMDEARKILSGESANKPLDHDGKKPQVS